MLSQMLKDITINKHRNDQFQRNYKTGKKIYNRMAFI